MIPTTPFYYKLQVQIEIRSQFSASMLNSNILIKVCVFLFNLEICEESNIPFWKVLQQS